MTDVDFADFYEATRHRVVAFLYAVGGDREEARDAAQEAYSRAWQQWKRLRTYDDPEAWVRMVGYRLAVNSWKRARNRLLAYRRHGPEPPIEAPFDAALTVQAALRELPADQRLVVVMHHLLDLSVADIARQAGIPVNTVKTRLSRGRRRLATLIGSAVPEEATNA